MQRMKPEETAIATKSTEGTKKGRIKVENYEKRD